MVGSDQYGYIKGPYYMVKPGPIAPGQHNKVESKKHHKLGRFPKLRAAGKVFSLFLFFFGSRLRIEISVGRVTQKAYPAFFFLKKSVTRLFIFLLLYVTYQKKCRSRNEKAYLAF